MDPAPYGHMARQNRTGIWRICAQENPRPLKQAGVGTTTRTTFSRDFEVDPKGSPTPYGPAAPPRLARVA